MKCINCSGFFVSKIGDLKQSNKVLGDFIVPNAEYEECEQCKQVLYSPKTLKAIEVVEDKRKTELLLHKPLGSFIKATEVAEILGCSRQAIHKHHRIRRGFIHFVMYKGTYYYLKESVYMFKETGDGRISLDDSKLKKFAKKWAEKADLINKWRTITATSTNTSSKNKPWGSLDNKDEGVKYEPITTE